MANENSILDKIIRSQQMQEANQLNPQDLIYKILKNLSSKEREILVRRFGLEGQNRQTLEQIGKSFDITRERIRQIQSAIVRKIKEVREIKEDLEITSHAISRLLQEYGGIMEESHFLEETLKYSEDTPTNRQSTIFIASQLLNDKIDKIKSDDYLLPGWKLKIISANNVYEALNVIKSIIGAENKLLATQTLLEKFKNHEFFKTKKENLTNLIVNGDEKSIDKIMISYLNISRQINKNILGEWGLSDWSTIIPKRMGDKIYLILKKRGKPMHFTEITDAINKETFDHKVAYSATIHNELIIDERYVLVGRGIYI